MPTITAPTLTQAETAPATAEAAWDLSRMLISDLAGGWSVTTTWPGQVGTGTTSAEKRVVASNRPMRTVRFDLKPDDRSGPIASRLIYNGLLRAGQCRSLVPLYPDYTTLTAPSAGSVLTCDTTLRRLFVGGLVAIALPTRGAVPYARFETSVILSLTGTSITLVAATSSAYPAGTRVFPLVLCDVSTTTSARAGRGGRLSLTMEAVEVPGASAIPALSDPGDTTSLWTSTFNGYPIFFPGLSRPGREYGWGGTAEGWRRDSRVASVGLGKVYELLGARPRATSSRTAQAVTRADAWPLLQFFDAVRGQTFPFYVPSPFGLAKPRVASATTVLVPAAGPLEDWQAYPYLAVIGPEPSPAACRVRAIQSVARSGGIDTVTLATALDSAAIARPLLVSTARLVRFGSADLVERWRTTTNLSLAFDLIELLAEQVVAISNL